MPTCNSNASETQDVMWTFPGQRIFTSQGWVTATEVNNDFIGATYVRTAEIGWLKFIAHSRVMYR